jgi:predicted alpha/beta-hydrolase family hydrolase
VLAHGAGAALDSEWMTRIAALLSDDGVRLARFEFAYMAARREGVRRVAPRADKLIDEYRQVVDQVASRTGGRIWIGGKSLGGRVASLVVDDLVAEGSVAGLAVFGYPFHPPGRPEKLRTQHLESLASPALICQGTRDRFGSREEVLGYGLAPSIRLHWLEDGDHELRPRTTLTGRTLDQNLAEAAHAAARFVLEAPAG